MLALDNVLACAEEEEGSSAIRALCFALLQALVADEGRLLVAGNTADLDALEGSVRELAVHLGRGDGLREDGVLDLEELEQDGVPLKRGEVHEERTGRVGNIGDVQVRLGTAGQTLEVIC